MDQKERIEERIEERERKSWEQVLEFRKRNDELLKSLNERLSLDLSSEKVKMAVDAVVREVPEALPEYVEKQWRETRGMSVKICLLASTVLDNISQEDSFPKMRQECLLASFLALLATCVEKGSPDVLEELSQMVIASRIDLSSIMSGRNRNGRDRRLS